MKVSLLDRTLIGVFPRYGVRRLQAKAALRSFEAAKSSRRTYGWRRSSGDANTTNGPALATLRELSRDLRRNNGWAQRGIAKIAHNTVGWGIEANAATDRTLAARRAVDLWQSWSRSTFCDFDERLTFAGMQSLVMTTVAESGECLVIRKTPDSSVDLPIPLQLKVVEPDLLDSSKDGPTRDGGYILQGIEFDKQGRRSAYWLFNRHPGGQFILSPSLKSQRIPASEVLHIYRIDRPGQSRGVPWLSAAIARLQELDEYADAKLMQQKIAACFAAFVQNVDGELQTLGEDGTDSAGNPIEDLEPGHVSYLSPGETVTFATPPSVSGDDGFQASYLRQIAVALGVTHEDLTGDYSKVNFSSARMARLSHYAHVHDWRWHMLIPQLCDPVWRWAMGLGVALGSVRLVGGELPAAAWSPPPMPMLEPEKEGLAYQRLVRSGAMTLFQVLRERGEDPARHLEEIEEINRELDKRGIILDADPRTTTSSGQLQSSPAAAGQPEKPGQGAADDADDAEDKADEGGSEADADDADDVDDVEE